MENDVIEALGLISKKTALSKKFPNYPCSNCRCKDDSRCSANCPAFRNWFIDEWRAIRKYFGKTK